MSELKNSFYNINDLCDNIKKNVAEIRENVTVIDKLGRKIDVDKYTEILAEIIKSAKELQMFNVEQFKR